MWPRKAAGFGTCILKGTMEHYGTWPWEISPLMIVFLERHREAREQSESSFHVIVAKFGTPLMTLVTCSQMFTDHFCYLKLAKKRTAYQA